MKILAFSGSNSSSSINQKLIRYCCQYLNFPFDIIDLRDYQIPMYSMDEEEENGFPADSILLYDTFKSHDAYIISIPEHNGNFPAFFKNILDWLTRIERGFFQGKPILLLNASPGSSGGRSVLSIAKKSFPFFKGNVIDSFSLTQFESFINNRQILSDDETIISDLRQVIEKFEMNLKADSSTNDSETNTETDLILSKVEKMSESTP